MGSMHRSNAFAGRRRTNSTPTMAMPPAGRQPDGTIDPNWARDNPDDASAAITRAEWDQYQKDFVPVENELLAKANDSAWVESAADNAGDAVREASAREATSMADAFARRGITPTAAQGKSIARRRDVQTSLAGATAENTTRRSLRDRRTNLIADTLAVGRGIATSATGAMDSAAGMASAREAQGRAASASRSSAIASGMTGIGMATGNPYLVAGGAVLGLLD
jgi:hypothetical protein